ncbi:MAG: 23S rRNA (guanosine(2251)-2'-O)-methyltransferase RlmB [Clostridia bacterium]|nr:23S rRNA (guanosine(2251)-2'-O)-methyltransferase RlmB [Erysipelotrichia bacterium]NCC87272.1 23S rRNA (guanosine(2251)-2'-O)-methyltransferase RlmB [Clostridia bacterium]
MGQYVYGKNVVKQLLTDEKKIYEVILLEGFKDKELEAKIKAKKIPCVYMNRKKMDQKLEGNHQGIAALIDEYKVYDMDTLLQSIPSGKLPLLVMLDGIEDPHNLGAILRTCDCVGADGVIIGKHRNVGLTPTVAKVSTGAIDTVKVAQVTNLSKTLQYLKQKGYWVAGTDMHNASNYTEAKYDMPLVLVIGSEGAGISPLVRKNCDFCIKLPMVGKVTSLNASVACGVLLYEIYSQRNT